MKYEKADKYYNPTFMSKIMGPNPLKLAEELLTDCKIKTNGFVLDLASGSGVTSAFIAKEYGFKVIAGDLWSEPTENKEFFDSIGVSDSVMPLKADANGLPFAHETFDGIICIDGYNYFGRDEKVFAEKILPYVKRGGYVYLAISGMKADYHADLPAELLVSWTAEQMEYMQDLEFWKRMITADDAEILCFEEMETNESAWTDWIIQDNDYSRGDKIAAEAGALKYLNFIKVVIRRK